MRRLKLREHTPSILVASLSAATLLGLPLATRGYLGGGWSHLAVVAGLFSVTRIGSIDAAAGREIVLSGVAAAVVEIGRAHV